MLGGFHLTIFVCILLVLVILVIIFHKQFIVDTGLPESISLKLTVQYVNGNVNAKASNGDTISKWHKDDWVYLELNDAILNFTRPGGAFTCYTINISNIKEIVAVESSEIVDKGKSIIGRAVAGGLIAGPAGAVVGGLTGLGTTKVEEDVYSILIEDMSENMMTLAMKNYNQKQKKRMDEIIEYINNKKLSNT
jgi:hypothetical protein